MERQLQVIPSVAETVYISHPTASFGTFCYNALGDLFLNSDWGFHCYAWRAFGSDFKKFLAQCNVEYIMNTFENTYRRTTNKKMPSSMKENVALLVEEFIKHLNTPPEEAK